MGMFWQSTEKGGISQSRFVKHPWVPGVGSRCSQSPPIDFKFSGTPEGHWVSRYFPQTLNKAQVVFSALPIWWIDLKLPRSGMFGEIRQYHVKCLLPDSCWIKVSIQVFFFLKYSYSGNWEQSPCTLTQGFSHLGYLVAQYLMLKYQGWFIDHPVTSPSL